MQVVIYGRDNCPYCVKAKALATKLKGMIDGFDFEYIDIIAKGLDKEDLAKIVNKPVQTVPQIILDGKPIGGFTEFDAYAKANLGA
ncbi:GrxA family glutaredoxin [Thorsellia anophelis]|uniref:Glutaredoxin 1 n=1 Tax=Thorsellia anophelis DSM 18579 TaxID=1123402 RepID=A0A1H9ZV70_9GAMM|nr:GrxA family glutaredoxin [Thorsellia anophelis]SES85663.1 glutaredoxin 1 [Thorsellia anophelis DSM 18579]